MGDLSKSEIIKKYPIGRGLDTFREPFSSACAELGVHELSDAVQHLSDEGEMPDLLQDSSKRTQLSKISRSTFSSHYKTFRQLNIYLLRVVAEFSVSTSLRFSSLAISDDFDVKSVIPLLNEVGKNQSDEKIWLKFYELTTESTPPRQLPYPHQTPISFNTGSFVNTSENRKHFNDALKDKLGSSLYIDVPGFFKIFFGEVTNLTSVAKAVFKKCQERKDLLYKKGERGG